MSETRDELQSIAYNLGLTRQGVSFHYCKGIRKLWRMQVADVGDTKHLADSRFWKCLREVCEEEGEDYELIVKELLNESNSNK